VVATAGYRRPRGRPLDREAIMTTKQSLKEWDVELEARIKRCLQSAAGAKTILKAIPSRNEWEDFCETVRAEWGRWQGALNLKPACLVALYCGVAFFDYEGGTFWPSFSEAVGVAKLPPRDQNEANEHFRRSAEHLGADLEQCVKDGRGKSSVISLAYRLLGIPISDWPNFLEVCHWAMWRGDWQGLSDGEWENLVKKRCGGHARLADSLVENREFAAALINEIIKLRNDASEASDPKQLLENHPLIRAEYVDEVPETAEFLLPERRQSARERVGLAFDQDRAQIYLRVPPVEKATLPARWIIEGREKSAGEYPDRIVMDAAAFKDRLELQLVSEKGGQHDVRSVPGIGPWAIFDVDDDGTMVNSKRRCLPVGRYALLSRRSLGGVELRGFASEDHPPNEKFQLSDGAECFRTVLEPETDRPILKFSPPGVDAIQIDFKPHLRIEHHLLPARSENLACFRREDGVLLTRLLPTLFVAIPQGFFDDKDAVNHLQRKFAVRVLGRDARGKWQKISSNENDKSSEWFVWQWIDPDRPIMDKRCPEAASLQELSAAYDIPHLSGEISINVQSPEFQREWKVIKEPRRRGAEFAWQSLPGDYLPMVLLSHAKQGMTWSELRLAYGAMNKACPREKANLLYKYLEHGYLVQHGARWRVEKSKAVMSAAADGHFDLDFCGNSGTLWGLYCMLSDENYAGYLQQLKVVGATARHPPFLRASGWADCLRKKVEAHLRANGAEIGECLWNH